jgi:hypothetical protein
MKRGIRAEQNVPPTAPLSVIKKDMDNCDIIKILTFMNLFVIASFLFLAAIGSFRVENIILNKWAVPPYDLRLNTAPFFIEKQCSLRLV